MIKAKKNPMRRILGRISVTVDEAVAILLKRIDGPVEFSPSEPDASPGGLEEIESLRYSLREDLEDEKDALFDALNEARVGKDADAIKSAEEALKRHGDLVSLCNKYRCAIDDELAKGQASALRLDKKQSNASEDYITLASLHEWAQAKGYCNGIIAIEPQSGQPPIEHEGVGDQWGSPHSNPHGLSKTKADNLYVSFAFLVEEFIQLKPNTGFSHDDGRPNVSFIADHLSEVAKKANGGEPLKGLSNENIKAHIEEAMRKKKTRLPARAK